VTGAITVIGTGPERCVIERLARAFEKAHLGTAIEIRWNRNFNVATMLPAGEADVAVSAREYPGLSATQIAWDGIAVIVNLTNPLTEVTSQQVAQLFSGRIANWSALHERGAGNVELIRRPADQHLNEGLERALGINGQVLKAATVIRSDQRCSGPSRAGSAP
jgi:phosphate transport system substrate-binding protein